MKNVMSKNENLLYGMIAGALIGTVAGVALKSTMKKKNNALCMAEKLLKSMK